MARPKSANPRSRPVLVKFTAPEYDQLKESADELRMSVTGYVRHRALEETEVLTPAEQMKRAATYVVTEKHVGPRSTISAPQRPTLTPGFQNDQKSCTHGGYENQSFCYRCGKRP